MIFRLEYKNRNGLQARLDITTPGSSVVKEIEGTEQPFLLSYKGDKNDKSLNFLTSSAEINIYETPEFNIDTLKTSNETQIKVDFYIDSVKHWTGFVIPDFFQREIGGAGVVSMVASDRLSTLKGVTLSDLPAMVSIRDLAVQCLAKTGLSLPLKTMADFQHGSTANGFFTSKIASQRLTDNKGRSISCYDALKSILVASNSRLEQSDGEWRITNKLQHELGTGRLYSSNSAFTNYIESVFNFSEITKGAMRSIVPVAGSVGVYHEHGGSRTHPENFDFSLGSDGLQGWTEFNGFNAFTDNRDVYGYLGGTPLYNDDVLTKRYLVNYNNRVTTATNLDTAPYLESEAIQVVSNEENRVNVSIDISALLPEKGLEPHEPSFVKYAVIATNGVDTYALTRSGVFEPYTGRDDQSLVINLGAWESPLILASAAVTKNRITTGELEADNIKDFAVKIRIYGSGGYQYTHINYASVSFSDSTEIPKGVIYKREQGSNYTKSHDTDTAIVGDYLTKGLDGYFYDYPIDDTSSLFASDGELTSLWLTPYVKGEPGEYPLLFHVVRQRGIMFSVAHDLISGEIEMDKFNPLSIFVDCNGNRYVVVSAEFDFLRSVVKVDLEEIAHANLTVRDFIYSYFGDGESGISSVGGIASGSGGGGAGGGMTADQLNILNNLASWWKLDDDGNLFTGLNVYSEKEVSAYGLGSGGSGGGGGSNVSWGTTSNNYSPLTVEGTTKTVALSGHTHAWGDVTGKPATFAPSAHTHSAADITSGTFAIARIPTGTTSSTVSLGNHTHTFTSLTSKPTTLSGYGITNAYTKNEIDSSISTLQNSLTSHINNEGAAKHITQAQLTGLNNILTWWKLDSNGNLYTEKNVYSTGEVSAYGVGSGGGGGGGSLVTWGTTTNNYSPLTVEGVSKTVALTGHTHSFTEITGTATTAQIPNLPTSKITSGVFATARLGTGTPSAANYLRGDGTWAAVTSANNGQLTLSTGTGLTGSATFTANQSTNSTFTVSPIFGTTTGTIAQGNDSRINNGQTAFGWGNHSNAGYALASRTITAGTGLTGGGTLSANRTLSLDTAYTDGRYYGYTDSAINTILNTSATFSRNFRITNPIQNYNPFSNNYILDSINTNLLAGKWPKIKVTVNGVENIDNTRALFDQNFEQYAQVSGREGDGVKIIYIDLKTYGLYPSGVTYPQGRIVANFYNRLKPKDYTARLHYNDGTWSNMSLTVDGAQIIGEVSSKIGLIGIEYTFTTGTGTPYITRDYKWGLSEIEYHGTRMSITQSANITSVGGYIGGDLVIDGTLTANATTATTLATPRTIWGQSFDGSGNVSGAMSGVPELRSAGNTYLRHTGTHTVLSASGGNVYLRPISNSDTTNQVAILYNGNMGLGNNSPAYKLDVSGTGRFTNTVTAPILNASVSVNTPKVIFNAAGWSMEQVGTELQMKHNGNIRMRFLSDGAIVATQEITAFA